MPKLFMFDFPAETIALEPCFRNEKILGEMKSRSPDDTVLPKVIKIYGETFFPGGYEQRPYTFSSIVLSSDGKMAFHDNPAGPMIARNNFLDSDGAVADFWVLNMLRAYSDGVILGARTLQAEALNTSHIFDQELFEQRKNSIGKEGHPANIVISFDGTDIPMDHLIFNIDEEENFPVALATSPAGADYIERHFPKPLFRIAADWINKIHPEELSLLREKLFPAGAPVPLFVTGEDDRPDAPELLGILRRLGMQRLLIESPSYTSHLMSMGMMDEFFINYSMVFAGGPITPNLLSPFSAADHPHSELVVVRHHQANFLYTRQKIRYGVNAERDLSSLKY